MKIRTCSGRECIPEALPYLKLLVLTCPTVQSTKIGGDLMPDSFMICIKLFSQLQLVDIIFFPACIYVYILLMPLKRSILWLIYHFPPHNQFPYSSLNISLLKMAMCPFVLVPCVLLFCSPSYKLWPLKPDISLCVPF